MTARGCCVLPRFVVVRALPNGIQDHVTLSCSNGEDVETGGYRINNIYYTQAPGESRHALCVNNNVAWNAYNITNAIFDPIASLQNSADQQTRNEFIRLRITSSTSKPVANPLRPSAVLPVLCVSRQHHLVQGQQPPIFDRGVGVLVALRVAQGHIFRTTRAL